MTLLWFMSKVFGGRMADRMRTGVVTTERKEQAGFRQARESFHPIFILRNIIK